MKRKATWKACQLMAYDNGFDLVMGTDMAVQKMMSHADDALEPQVLTDIEAFLAGLSDEDLMDLCIGDEQSQNDLNPPTYVTNYLNNAFEAEL